MTERPGALPDARHIAGIVITVLVLTSIMLLVGLGNYLLFHTLAEMFAVVISAMIFFVAWHTRHLVKNSYLMLLGAAYMTVGVIDLSHMLAYRGMSILSGFETNTATQLWVAARYVESLSFLAAPMFLSRKVRASGLLAFYAGVGLLLLLSIFVWPVFPVSFRQGTGLTAFKIASEYIICIILAGAMVYHLRRRDRFSRKVITLIVFSILATIASEICFTLYSDPYGLWNMTGHLLKIASFYLVYRATIHVSLTTPFELLFRELVNSEALLRSERDRAQAYFDTAGTMLMVLDPQGFITDINRAGCDILGDSRENIIGTSWFERFVPPDERETRKNRFLSLVKTDTSEASTPRDGSLITADGRRRIISWNLNLIRDNRGDVVSAVESGEDVTELRMMQAELEHRVEERTLALARSNEELQNEIIERRRIEKELLNQQHMLETMLNHQNLLANVASQINASEFRSRGINLLLEEIAADLQIDTICIWNARQSGDSGDPDEYFRDACFSRDTGHRRHGDDLMNWLRENALAIQAADFATPDGWFDRDGDVMKHFDYTLYGVFPIAVERDIRGFIGCFRKGVVEWRPEETELLKTIAAMIANDWKRHSNMLGRIEAEKKQSAAIQMAEKASRLASIGAVAGGITHEINQPLTAIKVNVDSILYWDKLNKGVVPGNFINSLSRISASVDRINQIIQHMRRFWTGPARVEKETFDINEVVHRSLGLVNSQLIAHGIETVLDLDPSPIVMKGNALQIEQVIVNLVVNAKNAHDRTQRSNKMISISTRRLDNEIMMIISDNGPGLPVDSADVLFDPFFSTGKPGEGMGLGLAIVKRIIDEHQGSITAANNAEGGAVFTLRFPKDQHRPSIEEVLDEHGKK